MYATQPNVLLVHPSVPANNLREFIALLKANPEKYSFGSAGNGTSQHISGELFKTMAGVRMQHIPYRGSGQMMPELLGGTLPVAFDNIATAVPHLKAGKLRALAVTTPHAPVVAPDVPTMAEAGLAGYDSARGRRCSRLPAHPADHRRLYTEIAQDPEDARYREAPHRSRPRPERHAAGPARRVVKADVPRLGKIVKESGARAD